MLRINLRSTLNFQFFFELIEYMFEHIGLKFYYFYNSNQIGNTFMIIRIKTFITYIKFIIYNTKYKNIIKI